MDHEERAHHHQAGHHRCEEELRDRDADDRAVENQRNRRRNQHAEQPGRRIQRRGVAAWVAALRHFPPDCATDRRDGRHRRARYRSHQRACRDHHMTERCARPAHEGVAHRRKLPDQPTTVHQLAAEQEQGDREEREIGDRVVGNRRERRHIDAPLLGVDNDDQREGDTDGKADDKQNEQIGNDAHARSTSGGCSSPTTRSASATAWNSISVMPSARKKIGTATGVPMSSIFSPEPSVSR